MKIALRYGRADPHPVDDLAFLDVGGVTDQDLHQEPVALRLGQRVDALLLDRVLGGHHQERVGHLVGLAADRHLVLGHHLEQRRLHLGGRAVDLVGEQEVDEHRAELDVELLGGLPVDPGADDVGRDQVGGELDPGEGAADDPGEGLHRERLGHPGHALEQAVAAGQEGDEHPLDHPVLAHDDPLDLEHRALELGRVLRWGHGCARLGTGLGIGRGRLGHRSSTAGLTVAPARLPTLKTYTTTLRASGQRRNTPRIPDTPVSEEVDLSARCAGTGTVAGWTTARINRVRFEASPGDFPRGRPALKLPSASPRVALSGWSRICNPSAPARAAARPRPGSCAGTIRNCTPRSTARPGWPAMTIVNPSADSWRSAGSCARSSRSRQHQKRRSHRLIAVTEPLAPGAIDPLEPWPDAVDWRPVSGN